MTGARRTRARSPAASVSTWCGSGVGRCYENRVAESFVATLEHELLAGPDFASCDAARRAIFEFVVVW